MAIKKLLIFSPFVIGVQKSTMTHVAHLFYFSASTFPCIIVTHKAYQLSTSTLTR